jgi:coenzyme F420-reducing hydrogenase beta subunit
MQYLNAEGFFRPVVDRKLCVECGLCEKACPSLHQDKSSLLGEYKDIVLAHSTNSTVRINATSGGIINTLVRYIINKGIVEAVLLAGYDKESPIETGAYILTKENVKLLLEAPRDFASRYVSVPLLQGLKEVQNKYKRIAVVGTSCHMRALAQNPVGGGKSNVDILKIGVTCSGGMSYKATAEYKRKMHLENSKMFYRGDGWPGKNTLIHDGINVEFKHPGSLFERMFSSQVFKNPGCRCCKDHFAEMADISFCDFWDQQELKAETVGNSCVILRSEEAERLMQLMQVDGYINVVRHLTEQEVAMTQMHVLKAKKGNLRTLGKYKFFCGLCDFVFRHELYRFFGLKSYQRFCKHYAVLCRKSAI